MLKLGVSDEGPIWVDMAAGVSFLLRPITTPLMMAARKHAKVLALTEAGEDFDAEAIAVPIACALGELVIEDWNGVGDADGNPVEPSPSNIEKLFHECYPVFEAFQVKFVAQGMHMVQEKNGSAPSPNGTSAAAINTAQSAHPDAQSAPVFSTGREPSKDT